MGTISNAIKRRLKPAKQFDCGLCGARCTAKEDGSKVVLKHPKPWCEGLDKGILLEFYIAMCQPRLVYPPLDVPKSWL